jgi:adenylate cyclase
MKKNLIFGKYIQDLNNIVKNKELIHTRAFSSFNGVRNNLSENLSNGNPLGHIEPLRELLGLPRPRISSGTHKDFLEIGLSKTSEEHYIVSVFMDVKNSTVFFDKYSNNQIALIIQTIQAAAIAICSLFDGHIQRLQYDGLFVYFGGKNVTKEKAIESALNATSFFSYFVKYELNEVLKQYEFDKISTRAGVDFGDDDDVTWYRFGIGEASEVTTVSLYTSLVPKMQSNAEANGIVIGNNTKEIHSLDQYVSKVTYQKDGITVEDDYIFKQYRQHKFNWQSWLVNHFSFIKREGGKIYIDYDYNKTPELKQASIDNAQLLRILGYATGDTFIAPTGMPNIINAGTPAPNNQNYGVIE